MSENSKKECEMDPLVIAIISTILILVLVLIDPTHIGDILNALVYLALLSFVIGFIYIWQWFVTHP